MAGLPCKKLSLTGAKNGKAGNVEDAGLFDCCSVEHFWLDPGLGGSGVETLPCAFPEVSVSFFGTHHPPFGTRYDLAAYWGYNKASYYQGSGK